MIAQDVSFLFPKSRDKKMLVKLNENMYPIKENVESNWLYYAFNGFEALKAEFMRQGMLAKTFATIGTGNGVDALGAAHIFDAIDEFILTDIDESTIFLAEENFKSNIDPSRAKKVHAYAGDLCVPLTANNLKADIIYANLPNIPIWNDSRKEGFSLATFFEPFGNLGRRPPKSIKDFLLELQFRFLLSSKKALKKNGCVAILLGGRFPSKTFGKLFKATGFKRTELCNGFKIQTEARDVLTGYAKAETENNKEFYFYLFKDALEKMRKHGAGHITNLASDELEDTLSPFRVNAKQALKLYSKGVDIGHTCHMFRGYL